MALSIIKRQHHCTIPPHYNYEAVTHKDSTFMVLIIASCNFLSEKYFTGKKLAISLFSFVSQSRYASFVCVNVVLMQTKRLKF